MDQLSLQKLIEKEKEIQITYRREKDEQLKSYDQERFELRSPGRQDWPRDAWEFEKSIDPDPISDSPRSAWGILSDSNSGYVR